jgi:hypothetical protein
MYGYDAAREELEIEWNSRYDAIHEMYHDLGDSVETLRYESQCQFEDDCIQAQDDMEARGGPPAPLYSRDDILF